MDGIPTKLLLNIFEQIRVPFAILFNLSLKEGLVSLEWKQANIIPLFKKVQETIPHTSEFNIWDLQTIENTN